jgi:hypothetical protein
VITDDEVNRLFKDMFMAQRVIAQRKEDLRVAENAAVVAKADLDIATSRLGDIERAIQRLAERAAGVSSREPEYEAPPKMHSEFLPVRR